MRLRGGRLIEQTEQEGVDFSGSLKKKTVTEIAVHFSLKKMHRLDRIFTNLEANFWNIFHRSPRVSFH